MWDVIVIGARVAGSSTAMLLARKGLKVLVVERASFPSDTLSTHQVQLPGVARLRRWGLLDRVVASGAPATRHVIFDQGGIVLDGHFPAFDGVDALYSPRRTVLDKLLVDAAREAGAEVREGFAVEELLAANGRVEGVRGRHKGGPAATERARLVVGADGKHSLVARMVDAATYREKPVLSMGSYTYWEGVPLAGGEIHGRGRRAAGLWPTNDGLVLIFIAWPIDEFQTFRTTPDLPNFFRVPYGPGWALVGDAGLVKDPITGQGIGDAFRDGELLADAIAAGLDGQPLEAVLAGYQRQRDQAALPMYEFTTELASFAPPRPARSRSYCSRRCSVTRPRPTGSSGWSLAPCRCTST